MLTVKEAAQKLGISVSRLLRWMDTGEIAVFRPAGCDPMISPAEVERILNLKKTA